MATRFYQQRNMEHQRRLGNQPSARSRQRFCTCAHQRTLSHMVEMHFSHTTAHMLQGDSYSRPQHTVSTRAPCLRGGACGQATNTHVAAPLRTRTLLHTYQVQSRTAPSVGPAAGPAARLAEVAVAGGRVWAGRAVQAVQHVGVRAAVEHAEGVLAVVQARERAAGLGAGGRRHGQLAPQLAAALAVRGQREVQPCEVPRTAL